MSQPKPTAIITGASSGIGRAISIGLAKDGRYRLCLMSRNVLKLEETKRLCKDVNECVKVFIAPCDFNDMDSLKTSFDKVCNEYGPIAVLVNNAGMAGEALSTRGSEKNIKHTNMIINVNLKAAMIASQICLPSIIECATNQKEKEGEVPCAIFQIGSILGTDFGNGSYPFMPAYNVSKSGQRIFNNAMFEKVKKFGIKCCCIMPGMVSTPMANDVPNFNNKEFMNAKEISRAVQFVLNSEKNACPTDIVIRTQRAKL